MRVVVLLALGTLLQATPLAAQDNRDIDAVARSVVRVIVIGSGDDVGMGSGIAITPNRIVTNAHVVAAAQENGGFVGIVPSEGRKRFEGRVVAYRADIDLAVIDIGGGRIPPAALYGGVVSDGASVAALGYPYAVDRALANGLDDVIAPQSPVKSLGHVAGRRSNAQFDTVLHDANIGRGNSGGPLVDACGRVVGINSFLSISEGIDSTFAFAISVRELSAFLKRAGVVPTIATTPCLSDTETNARTAALTKAEDAQAAVAASRAVAAAAKVSRVKQDIRDAIAGERENGFALAVVLFVFGGIAASTGVMFAATAAKRRGTARMAIAVTLSGLLMLGAVVTYFVRPRFGDVEDRYLTANPPPPPPVLSETDNDGPKICVLVPDRSRVTVSKTNDVSLDWQAGGCVNGKTQYGNSAGSWSRAFVPNTEPTVTVQSYDPAKSRYTVERYLMAADAMEQARAVRARYKDKACATDPAARQSVSDMETAIRQTLPPSPNERLVFDCTAEPAK